MIALILAVGALPAVHAGAKPAHGKKAAHKAATAKKRPPSVHSAGADAAQWKPDADLLAQLQPETQFGAFRMRLPAGYTVEEHDMPTPQQHLAGYLATGPKRAEGSFPVIFVFVGVAAPGFSTRSADGMVEGNPVINEKPGLVKSSLEDGETNGLQMVRQYYKYPARPGSSRLFHGFHYATTDGQTDALVGAMDIEPDNAATLPLAEAAALTLHRAP